MWQRDSVKGQHSQRLPSTQPLLVQNPQNPKGPQASQSVPGEGGSPNPNPSRERQRTNLPAFLVPACCLSGDGISLALGKKQMPRCRIKSLLFVFVLFFFPFFLLPKAVLLGSCVSVDLGTVGVREHCEDCVGCLFETTPPTFPLAPL